MPHRKRAAIATVAALGLLFGGCGSSSGGDASEPTTGPIDLTVKALDPGGKYDYDLDSYTAKAGTINVALVNEGRENHNVLIVGIDSKKFKLSVTPGQTTTGAVTLAARTYDIYCDIAGHRDAGMEAKLVVN
ncbi:MAG TPA: cupredoxin domain-containing protein [Acidimicrobiales bacterium]|nr:cupredoxin domain-containing protein [Acidimicrobiales bacterium]